MSKKLLNESTIRRFGQLANMKAEVVSNFIGRNVVAEEEEESDLALADDAVEDMPPMDMEMEMDMEADLDGIADTPADSSMEMAEKAILAVADALGVPVSIEGGPADMMAEPEAAMDLDAEEGPMDLDAEEGPMDLDAEEDLADLDESEAPTDDTTTEGMKASYKREEEKEELEEASEDVETDDALVNEIVRRVKARLASLSKEK